MVYSRLAELSHHNKICQRKYQTMSDNIIQLNEDLIKHDLRDLVRSSVEETFNALLDKEANEPVNAQKYEYSSGRQGYRSGHYKRNFQTTAGEVGFNVPKLKGVPFGTAIIERYRRRESSVEEALIEMYLAGVSVRRVEDITEALRGTKVSPATISNLNKKACDHIGQWRSRPLSGDYPHVYVDGVYLKRSRGGEFRNVSILVVIGVNSDGFWEIIGTAEGMKEDKESWRSFFVWFKERGLSGVRLIIGDKNTGMLETVPEVFPDARYQRCTVHFYRNIFPVTPRNKMKIAAMMLKAIHAQENKEAAHEKARSVSDKLKEMKLSSAAKKVREGIEETLAYMDFPTRHRTGIRTNNIIDRLKREIKRRTKAIGAFPDSQSALMLVCARLRHVAGTQWGTRRYMNMDHLSKPEEKLLSDIIAG